MDTSSWVIHDSFIGWLRQSTGWLYVQIYSNQFFFFDYWSYVHFWSGFVVFIALVALKYRRRWRCLVFGLIIYELLELLLIYLDFHVFRSETIKDQFTDVFVGLAGGIASFLFMRFKMEISGIIDKYLNLKSVFVAATVAFIWVGNFTYFFRNQAAEETFDPLLLLMWTTFGYLILEVYAGFRRNRKERFRWSGKIRISAAMLLLILLFVRNDAIAASFQSNSLGAEIQFIRMIIFTSFLFCFPILEILLYHAFSFMLQKAQEAC